MMVWDRDWSWAGWLGMSLVMLVFWGALIWLIVTLVRAPAKPGGKIHQTAEQILAERFARGEITAEEYEERRHILTTAPNRGHRQKAGAAH